MTTPRMRRPVSDVATIRLPADEPVCTCSPFPVVTYRNGAVVTVTLHHRFNDGCRLPAVDVQPSTWAGVRRSGGTENE